ATLSFADGVKTEEGDLFEIEVADFGLSLRNPLKVSAEEEISVPNIWT
ncbi:GguC protein, partial [Rhizobium ruizarguesonis]